MSAARSTVARRSPGLIFARTHAGVRPALRSQRRTALPLEVSATTSSPILHIDELTKRFGPTWALHGASFSIRAGEVLGLVGPNGSGKTTLLECLSGLLAADGGRVVGDGRALALSARREMLFYMPDGILPWPDQSVAWTLDFSASLQGTSRQAVGEITRALD